MTESKNRTVHVGTSLVLVVFIILALVTFAVMTAVSASEDYKASSQAAERTQAYYDASNFVEAEIARLDRLLHETHDKRPDAYAAQVQGVVEAAGGFELELQDESLLCTLTRAVNETQELYVVLKVPLSPGPDEPLFVRHIWQERASQAWHADNNVTLIGD